jgi:Metal binding domain of Ada
MRRILALMALVISAWYLSKRWRGPGPQSRWQAMLLLLRAGARGAPAMLGALAGAARLGVVAGAAQARAEYVRARAMATASAAAGMARDVSDVGVRKAEEGISAAAQGAADTATNVQEAAGTVADQAQEAARRAMGRAAEVRPLSPVGGALGATGVPEPLPPNLSSGEPSSGGPAGASQESSPPDSTETPTTGMEQPPVVDRVAEVAQRTSGRFIGNKTTRVFHAATSGHLPAEHNRVYFETQEEAIAAGFEPAENEGLGSTGL